MKPPQGEGLNKRAVISLSGYWPVCKTTRQPIKDPQKLADLGYVEKLRSSTAKIGARFCDYHPETGTCVFEVTILLVKYLCSTVVDVLLLLLLCLIDCFYL